MKLKGEQIIKALECCGSTEYKCEFCPIDEKIKDDCNCGKFLAQNALALIKELTDETAAEVAEKIFADIRNFFLKTVAVIDEALDDAVRNENYISAYLYSSEKSLIETMITCFSQLKKEYTEGAE